HPHGLLLSRAGCQWRRSSAASGMRQALASILVRSFAAARARAGGRFLFSSLASRLRVGGEFAGDHARLAPAPAAETATSRLAAAAPVMAQQCLAHAQSVVRGGAAAGAAP